MTILRLKDTLRGSRCQNILTNDQTNGWHNKLILRTLVRACCAAVWYPPRNDKIVGSYPAGRWAYFFSHEMQPPSKDTQLEALPSKMH